MQRVDWIDAWCRRATNYTGGIVAKAVIKGEQCGVDIVTAQYYLDTSCDYCSQGYNWDMIELFQYLDAFRRVSEHDSAYDVLILLLDLNNNVAESYELRKDSIWNDTQTEFIKSISWNYIKTDLKSGEIIYSTKVEDLKNMFEE